VVFAEVAVGRTRNVSVPMNFGLAPAVARTTACGQPKRQQSCMQPLREACSGIWQSMPRWLSVAMGQCGAQGKFAEVSMPQVRPAMADWAVNTAIAKTATNWRNFFIRLRKTIHPNVDGI
jgi:hypothetical protein